MKSIKKDLGLATEAGETNGRHELRRELGPILDELMNIIRIRSDTGAFSLDYPGILDSQRRKLRNLMIRSGLLKDPIP